MEAFNTNPIDQTEKYPVLGDGYQLVRTRDIADTLGSKGWRIVSEQVSRARKEEKQGYQKHLLRFEHDDFQLIPGLSKENDSKPQICLINSHDGTTSFQMFLGVFRMVCSNGLMVGTNYQDFRTRHSKYVLSRLAQGVDFMVDNIPKVMNDIAMLQTKTFTPAALEELQKAIITERMRNVKRVLMVNYDSSVQVRREEDMSNDAYTLMNRLQETIMRGGIQYVYEKAIKDRDSGEITHYQPTHTRTRRLNSITGQIRLNRVLFEKANELAS